MRRTLLDNVKSRCSEQRLNKEKRLCPNLIMGRCDMEETIIKYAMRRKNGPFVNIRYNPVAGIVGAYIFWDEESFHTLVNGYYAPKDGAENYEAVPIEVTYKVVETDVQEV